MIATKCYTLSRALRVDEYFSILDYGVSCAGTFTLVERSELALSDDAKHVLRELEPHLISLAMVTEWPGTRLHGPGAAKLRRYRLVNDSATILRAAAGLYAWVQPALPEDLSLWAGDEPWLVTISLERDAYMRLTDVVRDGLLKFIPSLLDALQLEHS